jgi:hypothetical protein
MIEVGNRATAYEEYNSTTTPIIWQTEAGTVYGGLLDVTTGVLTIDRAIVDMGTLTWTKNTVTQGNLFRSGDLSTALTYNSLETICEIYPTVKASERTDISLSVGSNNKVDIIDNNYSDAATFKTAVTGHNICYPLATPITYQLTPTQISAIVGSNNVFTDTNGDTSLEYYTNRGEQTVRIAEGVAVDVINNKNIDNLTTTNKTLVGAVNEVNGAITSPKDITSDYITMASGYTFISGKVYKQGKHIFGNIVLSGTLQGGNNTDTLGTIKSDYRTADPINGFCGISNGQWFTNNIGYVYIASSGGLQVATTPSGMNYAKIHLDYVTA